MNFLSDTGAPAHPAVLEALSRVNEGDAPSYGDDAVSARVNAKLAALFETDVEAWLVGSGTAANALALSLFCPPMGAILCHEEAHIERDERGAPEFFTGGGKLRLLPGAHGRIDMDALSAALAARDPGFVHESPAEVLSLTNLTECGGAYTPDLAAARAEAARAAGLAVHLDGARLANAVAGTGASPAALTWRAGVDVVTFGATKNGALGCEAIVLFGKARERIGELRARAKRAGHMPAKMRFLAAQLEALIDGELWLRLAAAANARARRLADGLAALPGVEIVHPVEGNEVFARLPEPLAHALRADGAAFYPWPDGSSRFVCAWSTHERDVDAALAAARRASSGAARSNGSA
ncbi:MAG: beta-eliminating lyase-related protein [Caulobacterales bacterium]|nr:beta-eliminating lyase-related protein [Caulobacterales bacterium]